MGDAELDISPDVLFGIAQLALEGVEGLSPIAPPARMGEILGGRRAKGIRVERSGDEVHIVLHVSVLYGLRIPDVAARAQEVVGEAISSMTGLRVMAVDVTVDAVDLPEETPRG